jgi:hypothetical protein
MVPQVADLFNRMNSVVARGGFADEVVRFVGTTVTVGSQQVKPHSLPGPSDDVALQFAESGDALADTLSQLPTDPAEFRDYEWEHLPEGLNSTLSTHLLMTQVLRKMRFSSPQLAGSVMQSQSRIVEEGIRVMRTWILYRPEVLACLSPTVHAAVSDFRIPWWANLRSMWNIFWSAIRHPFSETTIDLSTGRVLYRT